MMVSCDSTTREAHHQVAMRATNELASHLALRPDTNRFQTLRLACECGDPYCQATLVATRGEYDAVRGLGSQFLIVDRHENPEISVIVSTTDQVSVVDTIGRQARRIVLDHNPRQGWPPPIPSSEAA